MHMECEGSQEWSDVDVDKAIAFKAQEKPNAAFPWEELAEHLADLRVAEQMGKGAHTQDARELPLLRYNELLILRLACIEAQPAMMERAQEEADRKGREKAAAKQR